MKKIILIRGPICAGKSTTVNLLRQHIVDVSHVDFDIFKQQIDDIKSSPWRQDIALKTALFLTSELMKLGRMIIVDIHPRENQYRAYKKLAEDSGYTLFSFLLYPPLEVCLERNRLSMPNKYLIPDKKIKDYWQEVFSIPNEIIFDTSKILPQGIVEQILELIHFN